MAQAEDREIVDDDERSTHEIDHVRETERGAVAPEIEWNDKDPFFDRDLKNFHRLHAEGAVSVGVIVTRGASLQTNMRRMTGRKATLRADSTIFANST